MSKHAKNDLNKGPVKDELNKGSQADELNSNANDNMNKDAGAMNRTVTGSGAKNDSSAAGEVNDSDSALKGVDSSKVEGNDLHKAAAGATTQVSTPAVDVNNTPFDPDAPDKGAGLAEKSSPNLKDERQASASNDLEEPIDRNVPDPGKNSVITPIGGFKTEDQIKEKEAVLNEGKEEKGEEPAKNYGAQGT